MNRTTPAPVVGPGRHPVHAPTTLAGHLRHLLGFARGSIALLNHRLNRRYKPGPDFPLVVTLYLPGSAWPAVLQNLSGNGLGVRVDPITPVSAGQAVRVGLELGHHHLDIKARIAHLQPGEDELLAGIELKFDDFPVQKAYLELLHPVVIGQSLHPVETPQDEPGFIKQSYHGESDFNLAVWREATKEAPLHSVEFRISHYAWRINRPPVASPGGTPPPAPPGEPTPEPITDQAGGLQFEVHDLFRWVALNLAEAVPGDVRALVRQSCG